MKRFLAIAMLSVFVTSASASSEKQCKECETTWSQWFGHTAVLVMAELYAATKIPQLAVANAFMAEKAAAASSLASLWIMNKVGKQAAKID